MARFTDLPMEMVMDICDFLRLRGITVIEAFAETSNDEEVGQLLQQGWDDVLSLSLTCRKYQCLEKCLHHTISLHGKDFFHKSIRFLQLLAVRPEIAERVTKIYIRLERVAGVPNHIDKYDAAFIRQQAENATIPWSEDDWLDHAKDICDRRILTIASLVLGKLKNLEQLGLGLPSQPDSTPFQEEDEYAGDFPVVNSSTQYLALRPATHFLVSDNIEHEFLSMIKVHPSYMFLCGTLTIPFHNIFIHPHPTMFKNVTHLTLVELECGPNDPSSVLHIIESCAPLILFKYIPDDGWLFDDGYDFEDMLHPLHLLRGLQSKHAHSLRTLCINCSWHYLDGMLRPDSFAAFVNLEYLWVDLDSIVYTDGHEMADPSSFGPLSTLPQSIKCLCITDYDTRVNAASTSFPMKASTYIEEFAVDEHVWNDIFQDWILNANFDVLMDTVESSIRWEPR
ncbi:uncharacterized protein CTRU02_213153 [Colletotrichum truncatum]|uniref:Uncharacterized protein n=1 Tax=Colletotrichum truncatum TaxID=5467 RepID=A0ACC3YJX8_COLTU|nr:uncharacterized protein CTRU02_03472 [Colletotrichum truncatum]KAF6797441.1 hypothetical protein CTRU02_03472 [Colletotrichum truncatum]